MVVVAEAPSTAAFDPAISLQELVGRMVFPHRASSGQDTEPSGWALLTAMPQLLHASVRHTRRDLGAGERQEHTDTAWQVRHCGKFRYQPFGRGVATLSSHERSMVTWVASVRAIDEHRVHLLPAPSGVLFVSFFRDSLLS